MFFRFFFSIKIKFCETHQQWFHWYDWSKNSKIHGHLAACNCQNPLFLYVILQWIFWVQSSRLFSSALQWNKTNLLNMTIVFLCPSYFWPCIPGLFHGMVCKNTKPVAPNWSNMCYQTENTKGFFFSVSFRPFSQADLDLHWQVQKNVHWQERGRIQCPFPIGMRFHPKKDTKKWIKTWFLKSCRSF